MIPEHSVNNESQHQADRYRLSQIEIMNAKVLLKAVFLLIVLLLLVLMGGNNQQTVNFSLPPLITRVTQKASIMYFAFFAIGFLTGTVVMAGGGKRGSSSKSKSDR